MITIRTDQNEIYRISFKNMIIQYQGQMYHLKGVFKLCIGIKLDTLICNEKGDTHFFTSKGSVTEITEE